MSVGCFKKKSRKTRISDESSDGSSTDNEVDNGSSDDSGDGEFGNYDTWRKLESAVVIFTLPKIEYVHYASEKQ